MYVIVKDEDEIEKCQDMFKKSLSSKADKPIACKASFRGDNVEIGALWLNQLKIWVAFLGPERPYSTLPRRYWNAFGLKKPKENGNIPITAEINIPCNGEGGTAGRFIKDEKGKIYVVHTGRFGDAKRISPKEFIEKTQFPVIQIDDKKWVLIGEIESPELATNVRDLVQEVSRMKEEARGHSSEICLRCLDTGMGTLSDSVGQNKEDEKCTQLSQIHTK